MSHFFQDFLSKLFCRVDNSTRDEDSHLKMTQFKRPLDWRCVINWAIMGHFFPNSRRFLLESWATAPLKWINGRSQGDYGTRSDPGSPLLLKWVPSSCFWEINTLSFQWQTKTWTKQHPCSLMMISTLKRRLVVGANEVGIRGKVEHVSSLMQGYIIQQYLVMACIHSVNGSVKVTGVIQLNYDCNHDPCHQ